ncbi:PAS domain S-box-containing protein [Methylobacterium sp. 174MFSha1.1]|uniref:PAS domain S-box protein n=1 Tax=Methylobacterium sp. 174MFSha1.1 TaxID=1502749 RepID=UPI0008E8E3C6|nr:PAS domain S-box protein [Methylobacterium sp. 174MFSha1.1]SFV16795.1 PAS domain S-box-containing protein [Methylobacterium sp. 174MFSha1.1]
MTQTYDPWPITSGEMAERIRSFDWASTPLGPIERWPQSLKTIVDLMLVSPSMMSLVWGPDAIHLYNDRFTDLLREHDVSALGQSAYETFARSRDVFEADIAAGMAGRSSRLPAQLYPVLRHGRLEEAWFDVEYAPVRDEAGAVGGVLWTLKETTAQHLAEQALRASETRHRLLIESWTQAVWETGPDGVLADSPSWRAYTGQTLEEWRGDSWLNAVHPDDRALGEQQWREAIATCGLVNAELRLRAPDGGWLWTNVRAAPVLDATGNIEKWAGMNVDIDARRRAETALRQSEERLAAIFSNAAVGLSELALDGRFLRVNDEICRILGRSREEVLRLTIGDVTFPEDLPPSLAAVSRALRSGETASLDKRYLRPDGSVVWANSRLRPLHHGTGQSSTLLAVTADLTERRAAGERLRESEERFRQFADAASGALWVRDAATLQMEYVSPAVTRIYGVGPDAFLNGVETWASAIIPEDRKAALEHLEQARRGEAIVHEFRIQRLSDSSFRWIRNTEFPLFDTNGRVQRIGGIAEDVTEARLAAEHTSVLLAELQHRVRNIMAMIRSIAARTSERAASVPDYAELLMGRLLALARVQALLTRAVNVSVGITALVHDEVSVQAQHERQYDLAGPDVALSPKAAEVLILAVHELATNALKYGALSAVDGKVTVRWSVVEKRGSPWLVFEWTEDGAPERPQPTQDALRRRGFGSELIEARVPYELRGRGKLTIEPGGTRCHLEFPLKEGTSILGTSAPQRTAVFGGTLDMKSEPDLTGCRVLVVEDDFYLATDTARALAGAGAEVIGPCASEEDARAELDDQQPDAAVVDINLGPGPSFKLAETLKDRGIPFVFMTGYDAEVIPAEFAGVERLEKPFQFRQIVGVVAKLTTAV